MPTNRSNGQNDTLPVQFADIVGDDGVAGWETPTHAAGPERDAAIHRRDVGRAAERRHLRLQPERRHGLAAVRVVAQAVPGPEHHRRPSRARRVADRARLPHRSLGAQRTCSQRGRRTEITEIGAVRSVLFRSVRRPDAGYAGDVRQPAVPQRRRAGDA